MSTTNSSTVSAADNSLPILITETQYLLDDPSGITNWGLQYRDEIRQLTLLRKYDSRSPFTPLGTVQTTHFSGESWTSYTTNATTAAYYRARRKKAQQEIGTSKETEQLREKITKLEEEARGLREKNTKLEEETRRLREKNTKLEEETKQLREKNTNLEDVQQLRENKNLEEATYWLKYRSAYPRDRTDPCLYKGGRVSGSIYAQLGTWYVTASSNNNFKFIGPSTATASNVI
jgi:hypothetical protein